MCSHREELPKVAGALPDPPAKGGAKESCSSCRGLIVQAFN